MRCGDVFMINVSSDECVDLMKQFKCISKLFESCYEALLSDWFNIIACRDIAINILCLYNEARSFLCPVWSMILKDCICNKPYWTGNTNEGENPQQIQLSYFQRMC